MKSTRKKFAGKASKFEEVRRTNLYAAMPENAAQRSIRIFWACAISNGGVPYAG